MDRRAGLESIDGVVVNCSKQKTQPKLFISLALSAGRLGVRPRWIYRKLLIINKINGGGDGSRTRVRKCYWSGDYMLIHVHALSITSRRSRPSLRTDKKRRPLA